MLETGAGTEKTGDHQQRSGRTFHQSGLYRLIGRTRSQNKHGRQGTMSGQRPGGTTFRILKYKWIYVEEIGTPRELRTMLNAYMPHYNQVWPHSSLDGFVPAIRYLDQPLTQMG